MTPGLGVHDHCTLAIGGKAVDGAEILRGTLDIWPLLERGMSQQLVTGALKYIVVDLK